MCVEVGKHLSLLSFSPRLLSFFLIFSSPTTVSFSGFLSSIPPLVSLSPHFLSASLLSSSFHLSSPAPSFPSLLSNPIKTLIGLIFSDCSLVDKASLRTVMYRALRGREASEIRDDRDTTSGGESEDRETFKFKEWRREGWRDDGELKLLH